MDTTDIPERLRESRMKKLVAILAEYREFVFLWIWIIVYWTMVLLGGCCNIMMRTESGKRSPYFLQPHPYYSTANVWDDCICAPCYAFGVMEAPDAAGGIWYAIATITWPFWVVDEVCEVVLDTVFLPIDVTYYYCKRKQ